AFISIALIRKPLWASSPSTLSPAGSAVEEPPPNRFFQNDMALSPFVRSAPAADRQRQLQFAAFFHFLAQPARRDINVVRPGRYAVPQFDRAKEPSIPQRLRPLAPFPDHRRSIERAGRTIGKCHHQLERHDRAYAGKFE